MLQKTSSSSSRRPIQCASSSHHLSCFSSLLIFPTSSWVSSLFFLFLSGSIIMCFSLTSLSSLFFFCCCSRVILQHPLRLVGMRNFVNHIVSLNFSCFDLVFFLLSSIHPFHEGKDNLNLDFEFLILLLNSIRLICNKSAYSLACFFFIISQSSSLDWFSVSRPSTAFVGVILQRDLSHHSGIVVSP